MELSKNDLEILKNAKFLLENPSLAARLMNAIGAPIEIGFKYLPEKLNKKIHKISEKSLNYAFDLALITMGNKLEREPAKNSSHKLLAAITGGIGGTFGIAALTLELPVSTVIMLRSIADIARSQGENLQSIDSKLACLMVFALGGNSKRDDGAETGYYAIRTAIAKVVSEAVSYFTEEGILQRSAPILVKLINQIASRFGLLVSEKVAATAVPIIGAASGAMINTVFMVHFQNMANGHFIIRRFERIYGKRDVQIAYENLL